MSKRNAKEDSLLQIMGIASGFVSSVVFSLYIDSQENALTVFLKSPKSLWGHKSLFYFVSRTDRPLIVA